MKNIPYSTLDWSKILPEEHPGITGTSFWRVIQFEGLRIRMVEYSPNYLADHWCEKGHIVHCLNGEFTSELSTGEKQLYTSGMSYVVSDQKSSHRSETKTGCNLLIIDGEFLKFNKE